jgi:CBS domain containing-hemolysin-like protein
MNMNPAADPSTPPAPRGACGTLCTLLVAALLPLPAQASIFQGEALDTAANVLAWIVLVVVPFVVLALFWLVHILPEKIAEKRQHPQAEAIQTLCLLSLFFGGMLWPLAWLWAYSKPVLYKMAYGTDKHESHVPDAQSAAPEEPQPDEIDALRAHVARLEAELASRHNPAGRV